VHKYQNWKSGWKNHKWYVVLRTIGFCPKLNLSPDLYGKEAETEQTFVSNVQDIVQTLYDISQDIPSELDTSMRNFGSDLSLRTTAMLHLMLYQV
jgi:hypothetical protein